ncbi:hypothetical protein Tco_1290050 [Tanacetum coccineum]
MVNPDITMEEYVQLEAKKACRRGQEFNWELLCMVKSDSDNNDNKINIEISLEDVPIESSDDVIDSNVNTYSNAFDENICPSTPPRSRQLFEIRGPIVHELMLEFFSTCKISDTALELYIDDTLCFQLGGIRCQMI